MKRLLTALVACFTPPVRYQKFDKRCWMKPFAPLEELGVGFTLPPTQRDKRLNFTLLEISPR
ncbi:hypothetical protein [Leptolyngbya sp. FACHB-671]|uniref:hypothetical protein n=1 Tax=Leptolyngbya sp. FACHB-671 TaxID=2692812 RepID=UPI001A7EB818|nr:hypothetical protein [Leptolyngbya sp. FACHB-671]